MRRVKPAVIDRGLVSDRVLQETLAARAVSGATLGVFQLTSVSLYLNRRWTRPIWEACRAQDGRDWMLNSGVLRSDRRRAGRPTHAISALIFATYPLRLGERRGRRGTGHCSGPASTDT